MHAAVYAFGITLYELIARKEPYGSYECEHFDDILPLVANPGPDSSLVRPEIPASCPEELCKIIKECWAHHAHERPTFDQLAVRARALDLTAVGIGNGTAPVQEILYDMFPKHVSLRPRNPPGLRVHTRTWSHSKACRGQDTHSSSAPHSMHAQVTAGSTKQC